MKTNAALVSSLTALHRGMVPPMPPSTPFSPALKTGGAQLLLPPPMQTALPHGPSRALPTPTPIEPMGNHSVFQTGLIDSASDLAQVVYTGYNKGESGPISITPASLVKDGEAMDVHLVTLSGTELISNQSTGVLTDLKAAFNLDNDYKQNIKSAIMDNVPPGSTLVLAGHSLGGMVAQQIAADPDIKKRYTIENTVSFGAPLLSAGRREGEIQRLGDTRDPVPYMSAEAVVFPVWNIAGLNRATSGYQFLKGSHTASYKNETVWGDYDVLGKKDGDAIIIFNPSDQKFFAAPSSFE